MVDGAFEDEWKLEVEEKVLEYSKQNLKDLDLDKEIEESEIVRCIKKLTNNKTGGGDGIYCCFQFFAQAWSMVVKCGRVISLKQLL